jgi:protein-S-isoprenylcysteine O-methyltransferase Ste14
MRLLENRIPPPLVTLAFAGMTWSLSRVAPPIALTPLPRTIAAAVVAAVAGSFALSGVASFRRVRTTVNPLNPERASALVSDGIYRVSRNPMYVGMALLLVALAIYLASPLSALGTLGFVLYISRFQIMPEERALRSLFGAEFAAYERRVPRWL